MKIDNEESVVKLGSMKKTEPLKQMPPKNQGQAGSEVDQVQLSAKAKQISRIKDVLEASPDVRQSKVAEIKAAIKEGTYSPDTNETSENLIKESLIDLLV